MPVALAVSGELGLSTTAELNGYLAHVLFGSTAPAFQRAGAASR